MTLNQLSKQLQYIGDGHRQVVFIFIANKAGGLFLTFKRYGIL